MEHWHGRGTRAEAIVQGLIRQKTDAVILSEFQTIRQQSNSIRLLLDSFVFQSPGTSIKIWMLC